jgi:hypothetical protein
MKKTIYSINLIGSFFCFLLLAFFSFHSPVYPAVSTSYDTVQKIYIGYYQRPADPAGLIYWAGTLDATGGNLTAVIDAFANSPESKELYGTIDSSNIPTVVNDIYNALLARNAEPAGLAYWVDEFNSGRITAANIMLTILNGAQNEDRQSINNKLTAANLFTKTIDPDLDGSNFPVTYAEDDVIAARNFLTLYATSVKVPTQAETMAYIRANIDDSGYTGPLFDSHLHLNNIQRSLSANWLLSYLDRNKLEGAMGFYSFPTDKEAIIRDTRSRVIPLLQPQGGGWTQLASGQYSEAVLRQYLQPQGLLWGVGEIPLYNAALQSVTFDSPVMQTIFQVVNELKGIVMIHPSNTWSGRPTELAEVEPSIIKYPDVIFLFHGNAASFDLFSQLMSKYPNVYYTMDACNWYTTLTGDSLLYPTDAAAANAESFLTEVNLIWDRLIEEGLQRVTPLLQQYPDRIMWGTDLNYPWHFEEPVTDVVISLSRQLIGRLPVDIQEKYAYQNAQRVFGRFLTPNT